MSAPSRYTFRMAPKQRASETVLWEILEALARWEFTPHPVPIFVQVCPAVAGALSGVGLSFVRNWLRTKLLLDSRTPIIFEVYEWL